MKMRAPPQRAAFSLGGGGCCLALATSALTAANGLAHVFVQIVGKSAALSCEIEDRPTSLLKSLDQSPPARVSKDMTRNRLITAQNALEVLASLGHAVLQARNSSFAILAYSPEKATVLLLTDDGQPKQQQCC